MATDRPGWQPPAVGSRATWTRTITADDVASYAAITGDRNPLHFDEAFAAAIRLYHMLTTIGKTIGPLYGLPVSAKNCAGIKCVDTSLGMTLQICSPSLVPALLHRVVDM